jgi:RecB family exonuclease
VAPDLVTTAYGRAAATALHAQLVAAKRDEPLAPVTVIVPTNSVGVAARRLLASGELGSITSRGAGVIGVSFLTVYRLAELLAAPALAAAERRPVSTPVVAAAVRAALAAEPGLFAPVAEHPATEEALSAAHRDLADLDDGALDLLARQSLRARDVVRLHRAVSAALAPQWYAEHDLMAVATELVEARTAPVDELGVLVTYLPQRLTVAAAHLLRAVGEVIPAVCVLGRTGVASADADAVASARALGCEPAEPGELAPVVGTAVLTASDPDDEVRAVVRGVVDAMREGVPLERMAILFAGNDPYARLVHEQLDLAGVAHNGVSVRALDDCVLGGALVRLLALPDDNFRRDALFALLAAAPMLDGEGRPAPGAAWERTARAARVVGGLDQWHLLLDAYAAELGGSDGDTIANDRITRLRRFVDGLAHDLDPERVPASWSGKVRWAHGLLRRYFGDEHRRVSWPPFEREAARRVEAALDRLAGLDTVEAAPSMAVFRRTVELELAAARERVGRLGEGVLVGPVGFALGADFDRVFVCGLAEGVFPTTPRDDPLLSDTERSVLHGLLPLRTDRIAADHRALLAALAATGGERVLCFPRGDLRRSTEHVPSRYVLDTAEALSGARALDPGSSWCTQVASFTDGLARVQFPPTSHEYDLRAVMSDTPLGSATFDRGRALLEARRSDEFTRFDGNLSHLGTRLAEIGPAASEVVVSPTRLEQWTHCPHGYFMRYVLRIDPIEQPEDIVELRPIERGSIVHEVLDQFVSEGGTAADRERLHDIADAVCTALAVRGLAGRQLLWERAQRLIHDHLDAWLEADRRYRAQFGLRTLATEHPFGPIELTLSDARTVRFRGVVDRVDAADDGGLFVFDYKTGKAYDFDDDDPLDGGTRLQLPVYALAARELACAPADAPVAAYYWFVGRGENAWGGYAVDDSTVEVFDETLRTIVDGIEGGCFPARPAAPGPRFYIECEYCDPDHLGTADRWRDWTRKASAPGLEAYVALTGAVE